MFRRRKSRRLMSLIWPERGWGRAVRYIWWRMVRQHATPHAIAFGVAIGVAISVTPLLGFHVFLTLVIAWLLRANMLAALLSTAIGNPVSFPIFIFLNYKLGSLLVGNSVDDAGIVIERMSFGEIFINVDNTMANLLKPVLIGSIPLGLTLGVLCYFIVFFVVKAYRGSAEEKQKKEEE